MKRKRILLSFSFALLIVPSISASQTTTPALTSEERGQIVIENLKAYACQQAQYQPAFQPDQLADGARLSRWAFQAACADTKSTKTTNTWGISRPKTAAGPMTDGTLLAQQRLLTSYGIAVDLVAYASSDLAVGGILCYRDDGVPRSTVVHLHGGLGGAIHNAEGNIVETCINWAMLHNRTAFAPSYRGQDGGEGSLELCLGEADDVAAATLMLRNLPVTDPERVGLVGGSIGGCVALRAGAIIPNLKAVVAFVPPSDWKSLVTYHRDEWQPNTETTCEGATIEWNVGGTALADVIDKVICGHLFCSDAEYEARSTIPGVYVQTAPTLIVSAEMDNVVPFEQQLLYSLLREELGNTVDIYVVDHCAASASPAVAFDGHIMVLDTFHSLSPSTISSGLLFLMDALDR